MWVCFCVLLRELVMLLAVYGCVERTELGLGVEPFAIFHLRLSSSSMQREMQPSDTSPPTPRLSRPLSRMVCFANNDVEYASPINAAVNMPYVFSL